MSNIISNTNTPSAVRFEKRGDTFDIFVSDDSGVERKYIPEPKKGNGKIGIYIEYNPDEIQMKIKTSLSTVPIEYDQIKGKRFEVDLDYLLSFDMFGKEIDLEPFGFSGMRGEIEFYGKHVTNNGDGYFMGDKLELQMYNYHLDRYYDIMYAIMQSGIDLSILDHGEGMKILFNRSAMDAADQYHTSRQNLKHIKNIISALIGGDVKIFIKSKPLEVPISLQHRDETTTGVTP